MSDNAAPGHLPSLPVQSSLAAGHPSGPAAVLPADHPCTELPGCVIDHSDPNSYRVPCNQFNHHGPEHTIFGPAARPVFTVRRTRISDEGCEPIIEGWGYGADLEMTQTEAHSFAAQLRQVADRIDEEAERLAGAGGLRPSADLPDIRQDGNCSTHSWCLNGAAAHEDCQGSEISLESVDRHGAGSGQTYLNAYLETYDGVPMPEVAMLLDNWTGLDAAGLRQVITDIEQYLPQLRVLAAQLAVAEADRSATQQRAA